MFWDDISELKKEVKNLKNSLLRIEQAIVEIKGAQIYDNDLIESFSDRLIEIQQCTINRKTMDMFEDYMKNVGKINIMINEFKGCVSLARGALEERIKLNKNAPKKRKPVKKKGVVEAPVSV